MKEKRKRLNYTNDTLWVRQYREDQQDPGDGGVTRRDLEAGNYRLKKENKRLEMDCKILKKGKIAENRGRPLDY